MAALCLTKEDCELVLKNVEPNAELLGFELDNFSKEKQGFLGEHILLTLNIKLGGDLKQLTFFVKTLTDSGLLQCFGGYHLFGKEVFAYEFFAQVNNALPNVEINFIPKLVFYKNENQTIVLENLKETGYETAGVKYNKLQILNALEVLAKFHTVTIAYEEHKSEKLGRKYEIIEDNEEIFDPFFLSTPGTLGYKFSHATKFGNFALLELLAKQGDPLDETKAKIVKSVDEFLHTFNAKNNFRKVLSHGDLWGYNCLFKYENNVPINCKIIDFQLLRYTPPAHDLTMFIYTTSDNKSFQENVHEYYKHYYTCLTNELKKLNINIDNILPTDEFNATCKLYLRAAKFIWIMYRQVSDSSEETYEKVCKHADDLHLVCLEEKRYDFVKENFHNDARYREVITSNFENYKNDITHDFVSVEECYKIIEEKIGTKNYDLLEYEVKRLDGVCGFMGEHFGLKIKIKTEKHNVLQFFVKLLPFVEAQRHFATETGAIFKEMQFFRVIIPEFLKHGIHHIKHVVPNCYMATPEMLVLEDLKTQGYSCGDVRESMNLTSFKLGLKSLATFHACGIVYEEKIKEATGKAMKLNEIYPKEFLEVFYTEKQTSKRLLTSGKKGAAEEIKIFSNYTSNITPETFTYLTEYFIDNLKELAKPSRKYRNTISHADLWTNNVMLKTTPGQENAKLVDFQSYRYRPPAHDLMQFIHFSLHREIRLENLSTLLDYYYEIFKSVIESYDYNIDDVLTYEDFLKSCEEEKKFAIIQAITHFQTILMSPEQMKEFFSNPELVNKYMYVDRSELVRITANQDPIYSRRNGDAIRDLRELCENHVKFNGA